MHGLIEVLIFVLVLALIGGVVYWIITLLPLPEPFKQIVTVAFVVLILVVMLVKLLPLLTLALPFGWLAGLR